ncbi:MAG: ISAs1 family transposase [Moorea sp. SIO3I7]|uniref:ISAs1 family transposase n=1 Tax=unclassified Moorena TaxID=2683338 RepID=UPI0013C6770E|nr:MULTISPECIES: ISAs1 family transposase [unclassified Moorena]NEO00334.1 ISAs1 family transposase [Moorena sp. SIO3I7]NEO14002.1 ISAs1 family transposase [Moorena sp. SIO3E8]NEQ00427.1 ISAs1 family transposase [Moorena sp. SIO3F7]
MSQIPIIEAFAELEDPRRRAGQRHSLPLCLALFTVGYAAGNKGFLAIGDWISSYREPLIDLFKPPKNRLPSYSTVRRALLHINSEQYSRCLAKFFNVQPVPGETIGLDGKVLKHSYQIENDNPDSDSHPAIMLVSAYIVERGLILEPFEVDAKTNEIKALPDLIQKLALKGVVFAFDAINTQKKLVS